MIEVFSPPTTDQVHAIADDIREQIQITFGHVDYWTGGIVPSVRYPNYYAKVDSSGFFKKIIYSDGRREFYFVVT